MTLEAEANEATLINLRYLLADGLELCRSLSDGARPGSAVIEQMLISAALQVLSLMKSPQTQVACEVEPARLLSSAA